MISATEPSEKNSVERPDSSLFSRGLNLKNLNPNLMNFKNIKMQAIRKNSAEGGELTEQEDKIKQYENKIKRKTDRAELFKKLQNQLNEFKSEMYANSDLPAISGGHNNSSLSPKRSRDLINKPDTQVQLTNNARITPFRQDAKQYMDKVLNLMRIINEVDDLTNEAELKNKLQMQKFHLLKARAERDEHFKNY